MKVLIIGDNYDSISSIFLYLKEQYSDVILVIDRNDADVTELVKQIAPSLTILNFTVSGEDVIDLIVRIRHLSDTALLVLNDAHGSIEHAMLLEAGADDVISKSYSPIEILAKCIVLLHRTKGHDFAPTLELPDGMEIHFDTKEVFISGQRIHLTPIEFALLVVLVQNMGRIVSKNDLLKSVWGIRYLGDYNLLKTSIFRLRNKLRLLGERDQVITNTRGFGYRCGVY